MPAGSWDTLPDGVLAACLHVPRINPQDNDECSYISAARATCRQWRSTVDTSVTQLCPARWPRGTIARFPHLRLFDLSRLQMDNSDNADGLLGNKAYSGWHCNAGAAEAARPCTTLPGRCNGHHSSSHDLLMGASALCSRIWANNNCDHASSSCSSSSSNELDCVVNVRACNQGSAALTRYVASCWPDAVPHVTPAAALRIWKELPAMAALQALAINGAMLLVQSVRTSVDHCPDAAAGLSALQHFARDDCAAVSSITITHTYTLQLPQAVCQLTGLQSLSITWQLLTEECSNSSSSAGVLHGSDLALPGRRRSYEGPPSPAVVHVADPLVRLPSQFSNLIHLQQLCLAGSITGASALAPLSALRQLRRLALGPGELDMRALLHLRSTVVQQLQQLVLRQRGPWDARAVAALFSAAEQLEELEVEELEVVSPLQDGAIPPEQRLTEADAAPLAATLHTLHWATCTQRLVSGSSLLGRNTAAGAAVEGPSAVHAPGAWFGALASIQQLTISGLQFGGAVPVAPVLEVLSSSIGSCLHLQQLHIHSLGVPVLPGSLAQLPLLHTVSIASTSMARRIVVAADRALQVLGSCTALRSLTLAGCELRALPPWLPHLKQLTNLQLQGNYLQDLPRSRSLGIPTSLKVLNLNDNRLRDIPAGVVALTNLQQLHVDENYLNSLPQQVWQLPLLQVLSVKENMLPQLPELPGFNRRSSGEGKRPRSQEQQQQQRATTAGGADLAVASAAAYITSPADEEMALAGGLCSAGYGQDGSSCRGGVSHDRQDGSYSSSLKKLVLSFNQLCQLPHSISMLTALEQLDLDNNQLRALPDVGPSLWSLTRLTALQLANNHLKRLPAGLAKLQRLVELDVSSNHLPLSRCPAATGTSQSAAADTATAATAAAGAGVSAPLLLQSIAVGEATGMDATSTASGLSASSVLDSSSSNVWMGRPALSPVAAAGTNKASNKRRLKGCRSLSSIRQQLPGPLRSMLQLQQLHIGGQHAEDYSGHQCPLQLLLGGLGELIVKIRAMAPPHQCPVTRAASAAVAHLTAATSGKRAKRQRQKELLQLVKSEPGWVVLRRKEAAAAGLAAGAAAAAGGGSLALGDLGKVGRPRTGAM